MNRANAAALDGRDFAAEPIFNPNNLVFDYHDIDATCRGVGQILKPHRLSVLKQKTDFSASMHCVQTLGSLSICRLEYSEDVQIEPDFLEAFYLIQIPMRGYAEIEFAKQKFISHHSIGSIISPEQSLRMRCA